MRSIQSVLESTPQLHYVIHRARSPHFRSFSSTAALFVRRPMEKYEHEKPYRDAWGHTHPVPPKNDPQHAVDEFLRELAEQRQPTWTEKYGAHDGFGLKNRRRYIKGLDGQLIPWDAAGKDWRLATGYYDRGSKGGFWQAKFPGTRPPQGDRLPLPFFRRPPRVFQPTEESPAQKEWREAQDGDNKEATPVIETPSDIIQLNLDAWEANYKAAAESGMFVKRKSAQQIKRERKFLKKKMEQEQRRASEEERSPQEAEAEPTPWEMDQDLDPDTLEEISALPPSERKKLDPRIEGRDRPTDAPVRSRWADRGAAGVVSGVDVEGQSAVDADGEEATLHQPAEESGNEPAPEVVERFFDESPADQGLERATRPSRGRTGRGFGEPKLRQSTLGMSRYHTPPHQRSYSTAVRSSQIGPDEEHTEWIEDAPAPPRPLRDAQKAEERRAHGHAYREQVAAMFVPNRRRRYQQMMEVQAETEATEPKKRWEPTKKLTYPAMDGLRALHHADPATFTPQALSLKFGISREATHRILRSRWRERKAVKVDSLVGTKWAKTPSTAGIIERVYAQKEELTQAAERGE